MAKRVLVLGGLGYIGSMIYDIAKSEGFEVDILDNHLYHYLEPVHEYIHADIRNKDEIEPIIKKYDVIVHAAAIVGDPACLTDTRLAIDVNCTGSRNVAEICKKYDKKIIHLSTCSIYGSEPNKLIKETDYSFPVDFYGQTKYTQERLIHEICGDNALIFRLGTAYGLSKRMRYDLVVNLFAAQSKTINKISVFGGDQQRPFIHIRDVARAVIFGIRNDLSGLYNLRNDNLSIKEMAMIVKEETGCEVEIKTEFTDVRNYMVDNSKLLNTGFEPKYTIRDAIKEITESPTALDYDNFIYSNFKLAQRLKEVRDWQEEGLKLLTGNIVPSKDGIISRVDNVKFYRVREFEHKFLFHNEKENETLVAYKSAGFYIYVIHGACKVRYVEIDNWEDPSRDNILQEIVLTEKLPQFLFIPPGIAFNYESLMSNTEILLFSNKVDRHEMKSFPISIWKRS